MASKASRSRAIADIFSSRSSVPTVERRSPTPGCRFSTPGLRGTTSSSRSGRHSFIRWRRRPRESTSGLSEIILASRTRKGQDVYAVIERDNQLAIDGQLKRVYTFTLEGLTPEDIGTPVSATSIVGSTVTQALLKNVQPQFTPYEKVEGLAVTWAAISGWCWTTTAASSNLVSCGTTSSSVRASERSPGADSPKVDPAGRDDVLAWAGRWARSTQPTW